MKGIHPSMQPVNRVAARVVSGGTHFNPHMKPHTLKRTEVCPPLCGILKGGVDLAGVRFGRFTVVGLAAERNEGKEGKRRWICRCDCGLYEPRTGKAIQNPRNAGDRCHVCRATMFVTTGSSDTSQK